MPGLWRGICRLAARFRYYDGLTIHLRTLRMQKPKSFLRVFTESGPLIALAVAVALLVGIVGPASAQFFNFGGPPQRPQPRSNGGVGGGGVCGGGGWVARDAAAVAAGSAATCSRHSSSRRRGGLRRWRIIPRRRRRRSARRC